MNKIRIIFCILTIIWMITVFKFSSQPAIESENTSSSVTRVIVKLIYGENIENFEEKVKDIDPIIRKFAHYTLYVVRWSLYCWYDIYI